MPEVFIKDQDSIQQNQKEIETLVTQVQPLFEEIYHESEEVVIDSLEQQLIMELILQEQYVELHAKTESPISDIENEFVMTSDKGIEIKSQEESDQHPLNDFQMISSVLDEQSEQYNEQIDTNIIQFEIDTQNLLEEEEIIQQSTTDFQGQEPINDLNLSGLQLYVKIQEINLTKLEEMLEYIVPTVLSLVVEDLKMPSSVIQVENFHDSQIQDTITNFNLTTMDLSEPVENQILCKVVTEFIEKIDRRYSEIQSLIEELNLNSRKIDVNVQYKVLPHLALLEEDKILVAIEQNDIEDSNELNNLRNTDFITFETVEIDNLQSQPELADAYLDNEISINVIQPIINIDENLEIKEEQSVQGDLPSITVIDNIQQINTELIVQNEQEVQEDYFGIQKSEASQDSPQIELQNKVESIEVQFIKEDEIEIQDVSSPPFENFLDVLVAPLRQISLFSSILPVIDEETSDLSINQEEIKEDLSPSLDQQGLTILSTQINEPSTIIKAEQYLQEQNSFKLIDEIIIPVVCQSLKETNEIPVHIAEVDYNSLGLISQILDIPLEGSEYLTIIQGQDIISLIIEQIISELDRNFTDYKEALFISQREEQCKKAQLEIIDEIDDTVGLIEEVYIPNDIIQIHEEQVIHASEISVVQEKDLEYIEEVINIRVQQQEIFEAVQIDQLIKFIESPEKQSNRNPIIESNEASSLINQQVMISEEPEDTKCIVQQNICQENNVIKLSEDDNIMQTYQQQEEVYDIDCPISKTIIEPPSDQQMVDLARNKYDHLFDSEEEAQQSYEQISKEISVQIPQIEENVNIQIEDDSLINSVLKTELVENSSIDIIIVSQPEFVTSFEKLQIKNEPAAQSEETSKIYEPEQIAPIGEMECIATQSSENISTMKVVRRKKGVTQSQINQLSSDQDQIITGEITFIEQKQKPVESLFQENQICQQLPINEEQEFSEQQMRQFLTEQVEKLYDSNDILDVERDSNTSQQSQGSLRNRFQDGKEIFQPTKENMKRMELQKQRKIFSGSLTNSNFFNFGASAMQPMSDQDIEGLEQPGFGNNEPTDLMLHYQSLQEARASQPIGYTPRVAGELSGNPFGFTKVGGGSRPLYKEQRPLQKSSYSGVSAGSNIGVLMKSLDGGAVLSRQALQKASPLNLSQASSQNGAVQLEEAKEPQQIESRENINLRLGHMMMSASRPLFGFMGAVFQGQAKEQYGADK